MNDHIDAVSSEKYPEINGHHYTIAAWLRLPRQRDREHVLIESQGVFRVYVQKAFGLLHYAHRNIGDLGCGVVDDGRWHHVAICQDGYDLTFYLDGTALYTFDVPGGLIKVSPQRIVVGGSPNGGDPHRGKVEAVTLVSRTLRPDEIVTLMNRTPHPNPPATRDSRVPPAPLFEDPLFNSAKDGTVVWNRQEQTWWFLYMQIRNGLKRLGRTIHHGTTIGVASSPDGLRWTYRGTLNGLEFEPGARKGENTFWAPDIVWYEGAYHMLISYVRGHASPRGEGDRRLMHYQSRDLRNWEWVGTVTGLESLRTLDAGIYRLPDGKWGIWYKDEVHHATGYAESEDLLHFRQCGHMDTAYDPVEGADLFHWKGYYWLLGDDCHEYDGLRVYRSTDCRTWERLDNIMREGGRRNLDVGPARHPEVILNGDDAYIFYWTKSTQFVDQEFASAMMAFLQVAKLDYEDGMLHCDRNREFELHMPEPPA